MRVGFIRELTNLVPLARWARWIGVRTYLQGGLMSDRAGVCWLSLAESKQTEGVLCLFY